MKALIYSCLFVLLASTASAQVGTIVGSTNVFYGDQVTYTFQNDFSVWDGQWDISGGTELWRDSNPATYWYSITVYWGTPGTGSVTFRDGFSQLDIKYVTVNPPPDPPSSVTNGARCGAGGQVTISAVPGANANTIRWWDSPTMGSLLHVGTSFSPVVNSTTTFYASSFNNSAGRESTSRAAVTATVHPIPSLPSSSAVGVCGSGQVLLSGTSGANGNTIRWYNSEGVFITTNPTYMTPPISSNTTYFLSSYNSSTGCESGQTSVVAPVYPIPSLPTGVPNGICGPGEVGLAGGSGANGNSLKWYTVPINGTPVGTGLTFPTPYLTSTTTYYIASYNSSTGCEGTSRVAVTATINPIPGTPSAVPDDNCGTGQVFLGGNPGVDGDDVKWYTTSTGPTLFQTGTVYQPTLSSTTTYYISTIRNAGYCESARVPVTATINPIPGAASTTSGARCGPGLVGLSATAGSNGNSARWYAAPSGGSPLATGLSYAPNISSTTTYYVSSYNTITGCESTAARTAVTGTVNLVPSAVASAPGGARCSTGVVLLIATPGANGNQVRWYDAPTNGNLLATGLSFNTPSLSATTTYYTTSYNSTTGCESTAARTAQVATINSLPPIPTTAVHGARCGTGSVNLSATPGSGSTQLRWYSAPSGGSPLPPSPVLTYSPSITTTTSYYAASYNVTTGCESASRLTVTGTVNTVPAAPGVTGNFRIGPGTLLLTGTGTPVGGSYRWYNAAGTPLGSAATQLSQSVSVTTTNALQVKAMSSALCESAAFWVTLNVEPAPTITSANNRVAMGVPVTLSTTVPYNTYDWKNNAGTTVSTQSTLVSNVPGSYTVTVSKTGYQGTATSPQYWIRTQYEGVAENMVVTNTVLVKGKKNISDLTPLPIDSVSQTTEFFDGLGRPRQTVSTQQSPGKKDKITSLTYDAAGRELIKYLPYTSGTDGLLKANATTGVLTFYNNEPAVSVDTRPYDSTGYEPSPLDRVRHYFGPGADWKAKNKKVVHEYLSNVDGTGAGQEKIIIWELNGSGMPVRMAAVNSGFYPSNALTVKVATDESGTTVREYTNKEGKMILRKVMAVTPATLNNADHWAQTYYIYDFANNLRYVLQPVLSRTAALNNAYVPDGTALNNYAFQYQYDGRDRMTQKRAPGGDWLYMVYDSRDRIVLMQDGVQRAQFQWTFTKYDHLNRPILTGMKDTTATVTQAAMQAAVQAHYNKPSSRMYEVYVGNVAGNMHGYSNKAYPVRTVAATADDSRYLTVTYYDNYAFKTLFSNSEFSFKSNELPPTSGIPGQVTTENLLLKGQVTGTKTRMLSAMTWLKEVKYYDDKYHLVQRISETTKGHDVITTVYDFVGKELRNKSTTYTGQSVQWSALANATASGETLTSTASAWTSGAISSQTLAANTDGWVEITVASPTVAFGLSATNANASFSSIGYGMVINSDYTYSVYENGTSPVGFSALQSGDVLRVERSNGRVYYKRNGGLVHTSTVASTTLLMADFAIWASGLRIEGARVSHTFSQPSALLAKGTVVNRFEYDHAGRIKKNWFKINSSPEFLMVAYTYNELGELIDKNIHEKATNQFHQSVDHRYNVRGWLTSINNSDLTSAAGSNNFDGVGTKKDLFGMDLAYNADLGTGNANVNSALDLRQYAGNLSAMCWSVNSGLNPVKKLAYNFKYDPMNRLIDATSRKQTVSTWSMGDFHERGLVYDLNGNILELKRKGAGNVHIDSLLFNYGTAGNRLQSVTDLVSNPVNKAKGFVDIVGTDYTYSANGNMLTDQNKRITSNIVYNHLNLPVRVFKGAAGTIDYEYDATGRKWGQRVTFLRSQKLTEYVGSWVFEYGVAQFAQHPEGRVNVSSNNEVFASDGEAVEGFTITPNVTVAPETTSTGEKVLRVSIPSGVSKQKKGIMYGPVPVAAGERYVLRVKGSRNAIDANLYVKGNVADILYPGAHLNSGSGVENFIENTFTIPPGTTEISVGVVWQTTSTTDPDYFFVNHFTLTKIVEQLPEYQYHLKDHQGNIRVTFTTKNDEETAVATMEDANALTERSQFVYYDEAVRVQSPLFDRTKNGVADAVLYDNNFTSAYTPITSSGTIALSLSNGRLLASSASLNNFVSLGRATIDGRRYKVSFDLDVAGSGAVLVSASDGVTSTTISSLNVTATGTSYSLEFVAQSAGTNVLFTSSVTGPRNFYIDNLKVEELSQWGYATRLNGTTNERNGLVKTLSVMPGDTIDAEVFVKYLDPVSGNWTPALATFMSMLTGGTHISGTFLDGGLIGSMGGAPFPYAALLTGKTGGGVPKAYLNYLVFDRDWAFISSKSGYVPITSQALENGSNGAHERLAKQIIVDQPGYVYLFISNDNVALGGSQVDVYFDDFRVDHSRSALVQSQDYYPFGMAYNSHTRESSSGNLFLYNGKEVQDELGIDWLDYGARMYMPELGRWGVIDPLSEKYYAWTPYNYCFNNPIRFVDPNGMDGDFDYNVSKQTTEVRSVEVDGKMYTQVTSTKETTTANDWEYSKEANWPSGPVPKGDITTTTSTTTATIDGDGKIVSTSFSETKMFKGENDKEFKTVSERSGTVDVKSGEIKFSNGESQAMDINLATDIKAIANFNAKNDIDFPRAAAQDQLDDSNDALDVVGLIPMKTTSDLVLFMLGKTLPSASDLAQKGFGIQDSQEGNVGAVTQPPQVVRQFNSSLLKP